MCSLACINGLGSDCVAFAFDEENKTCELGDIQDCAVVFDSSVGDNKKNVIITDAYETKTGKLIAEI